MKDIDAASVPKLRPGVRLRTLDGGESVLLVPEGAVKLSASSAAVVESIDGRRSVAGIVARLSERFDAAGADLPADVAGVVGSLCLRQRWPATCWLTCRPVRCELR